MNRRSLFALILTAMALVAAPAAAQEALPRVAFQTSAGTFTVEVDTVRAPITATNFLRYVDEGRFEGTTFYRAMAGRPDLGLIQGGTNNDPERVLPPIAHEPTTETGLSHTDGVISMARWDPGTATGDFTIMVGDNTYLDARPGGQGDDAGYAAFGRVIQGMEVVRAILAAPRSATEGEGVMRGQMLEPRIEIQRVWRLEN